MLFRTRGYLPHLESEGSTYFVTFRLAGTMPRSVLQGWQLERDAIVKRARSLGRDLSAYETTRLWELQAEYIEKYLDSGVGECWLNNPDVAKMVVNAMNHFNGLRYFLHAWCVMPNHSHVVFTPTVENSESHQERPLAPIMHSWKSFTASEANRILRRAGQFWQEEYYDHLIRDEEEFLHFINYTLQNPVKAGLCRHWTEWKWSGCSERIAQLMDKTTG
jgi:REP element-mobilizing transposase RayT